MPPAPMRARTSYTPSRLPAASATLGSRTADYRTSPRGRGRSAPTAGGLRICREGDPSRGHVPLSSGTRLGPYEIVTAIGAGGMGEVYRARDLRLQRDVAVKVLPAAFTTDRDRLARFER